MHFHWKLSCCCFSNSWSLNFESIVNRLFFLLGFLLRLKFNVWEGFCGRKWKFGQSIRDGCHRSRKCRPISNMDPRGILINLFFSNQMLHSFAIFPFELYMWPSILKMLNFVILNLKVPQYLRKTLKQNFKFQNTILNLFYTTRWVWYLFKLSILKKIFFYLSRGKNSFVYYLKSLHNIMYIFKEENFQY